MSLRSREPTPWNLLCLVRERGCAFTQNRHRRGRRILYSCRDRVHISIIPAAEYICNIRCPLEVSPPPSIYRRAGARCLPRNRQFRLARIQSIGRQYCRKSFPHPVSMAFRTRLRPMKRIQYVLW